MWQFVLLLHTHFVLLYFVKIYTFFLDLLS